jgi:hypothetical protein
MPRTATCPAYLILVDLYILLIILEVQILMRYSVISVRTSDVTF